ASESGNLCLTTCAGARAGGEQGVGFEPGKPDESLLIEVISGDKPTMPKNAPALTKEQVELISRWVQEGASDDTPAEIDDTISAERPPVYHSAPVISAVAWSPDGQLIAISGFREIL